MSTPTKVQPQGRDRALGPREQAYARRGMALTWITVALGLVAAFSWIAIVTAPPGIQWTGLLVPMAWAFTSTVLAAAVLAARLVVGALRAGAEAVRQ